MQHLTLKKHAINRYVAINCASPKRLNLVTISSTAGCSIISETKYDFIEFSAFHCKIVKGFLQMISQVGSKGWTPFMPLQQTISFLGAIYFLIIESYIHS